MKQITVNNMKLVFDAVDTPLPDIKQSEIIINAINLTLQQAGLNVQPQLIWEDPNTESIEVNEI